MTLHQCSRCKKTFEYEYLLQRHYKRKYQCNKIIETETTDSRLERIDSELSETKKELNDTKQVLNKLVNTINEDEICNKTNKFDCRFCPKSFNFRTNLTKHLKVCKNKIDNISIYEKELGIDSKINKTSLSCAFCNKQYYKKKSLSQHVNRGCRERDLYESELRERVLENRRAAAAHITNNTTNNNNNTTNNNTIVINLPQMRAFGQENIDYMTTKLLLKELESYKQLQTADIGNIVSKFTQLMHANPAHPENHNVLFKSLNSGYARIYNGTNFEDRQSTEVQDEIISRVGPMIGKVCDEASLENEKETITDTLDEIDSKMSNMISDSNDGKDTRQLSRCRNAVKAALHTHTIQIENTQQLN